MSRYIALANEPGLLIVWIVVTMLTLQAIAWLQSRRGAKQ